MPPNPQAPRPHGLRRSAAVLAATLLVLASIAALAGRAGPAPTATLRPVAEDSPAQQAELDADRLVTLDGRRGGPRFWGVGAISGGGGNSRYLVDYPPAQRAAILNELFLPGHGASLQLLKLEIGGGANSSDGAEPSAEPTPGHMDCAAGYELWLAHQAVLRDPSIQLYGLQWSAPAWVRGPGGTLWTAADIRYLLGWLGCATRAGLHVGFLGGWNEHYPPGRPAVERWYEELRAALDAHGYRSVEIVAADSAGFSNPRAWAVAGNLATNPAFARAVSVVGVHDVCGSNSTAIVCDAPAVARRLAAAGMPLWQSELGRTPVSSSTLAGHGPGGLARALVNGYVDAGLTATILWPAVDAMPPGLPFSDRGLITADQPWSGYYRVNLLLWVIAQTTEFTHPGWRLLAGGDGTIGDQASFVTYVSPRDSAWSMVAQTSTATGPVSFDARLTGGLPTTVHVWGTQLRGPRHLVDLGQLPVTGGRWRFVMAPGAVYTFTSTAGPPAGAALPSVPPAAPLAARWAAGAPDAAGMAPLLSPMEGSFSDRGGVVTQTTSTYPVPWHACPGASPYAVVGAASWSAYTVSARVSLPSGGSSPPGAQLIARFGGYRRYCRFNGDVLTVDSAGQWTLGVHGVHPALLAAGRVPPSRSYGLSLGVGGDHLVAAIDGRRVASVVAHATRSGPAGIGTTQFDPVSFSGLRVTPSAH